MSQGPYDTRSPVPAPRLHALDELRGFAVLGILLLNILGFGLHSAGYFNPLIGSEGGAQSLNLSLWALIDVSAEGAMRALFSMLFGAGVVLFATGTHAKSAAVHFRRHAILLLFGLINGFVLLWPGDILVTYALCGCLLYPLRNWRPRALILLALVLLGLLSLVGVGALWGTGQTRSAAQVPAATLAADPERAALAAEWQDYESSMRPSSEEIAAELAERTGSAGGAFVWYAAEYWDVLLFSVPAYLFWDALAMMLLGMALMKLGVISGSRSTGGYLKLLGLALPVGLTINSAEVWWRLETELDPLYLFSYFLPSYQFGRLAMGLAWMAALFLLLRGGAAGAVAHVGERLRAVGRMALTNYLMHSLVALVLFTGVGFGLAGELSRAFLYLIVIGIWAFQLWWSPRWLASHAYGPCEWLWRALTYGRQPPWKSAAGSAA